MKPYKIEVKPSLGRGRGVFAIQPISRDELIESCPVIRFEPRNTAVLEATPLHDYLYSWSNDYREVAIALGYGSLYNHSYQPNSRYDDDAAAQMIFTAIRDIAADEEITINYNGAPGQKGEVGFPVI